jgi:hypothetical protein
MPLIALYEASSHALQGRGKDEHVFASHGEALNASATEEQRKILNIRYRVFYCLYCMNEL